MSSHFTGERFVPGYGGPGIHLEHLHRYYLAASMLHGSVLDLGSGIGYGSSLLAGGAERVVGLDLSVDAVHEAGTRFVADNLHFLVGDCRRLPFDAESFDWVVCFELIEHVAEGEEVLAQIRRVLGPEGKLLISTPNRASAVYNTDNPFHLREFDGDEFRALVGQVFENVAFLGQGLFAGSRTWLLDDTPTEAFELFRPDAELAPGFAAADEPIYFLACCSDGEPVSAETWKQETALEGRLEAFLEERESQFEKRRLSMREAYESAMRQLDAGTARPAVGEGGSTWVWASLIADLTDQLAAAKEVRESFDQRLGNLEEEKLRLLQRLAHFRGVNESLERTVLRLESERSELAQQLARVEGGTETLGQVVSHLESEKTALAKQVVQVEGSNDSLQHLILRLENDKANLAKELGGAAAARELLKKHVDVLEELRGESHGREARLVSEKKRLEAELADSKSETAALQQQVSGLKADVDWSYSRWQERKAQLETIHRSKMWRFWMAYHALRRTVTRPISTGRKLASNGARSAYRLGERLSGFARWTVGWLYLLAWTTFAQTAAALRVRRRRSSPSSSDLRPASFERRPRILIVCPYPIYPPNHGGGVRLFNLIRHLAEACDLYLWVFIRADDDPEQRRALEPLVEKLYFHRWQPALKPDRWGLLPRSVQLFSSRDVQKRLGEIVSAERIDILQLEFTEMGQFGVARNGAVKVVLSEIDITFRSRARRRAQGFHQRYPADRAFGHSFGDWMRQLRFEIQVVRQSDQVHVMSEEDADCLARYLPAGRDKLEVVPNAVDTASFRPRNGTKRQHQLLFVGNFQHLPNMDALDFLMTEVWPLVRRDVPRAQLAVVGAQADERVFRYDGTEGVTVVGEVPDIRPCYQEYRALLAPIRAGSGTRLKILEALACGMPVVSTALGAEGIDCTDDRHLLIADGPAAFAVATARLLQDDELCKRLGAEGRRLAVDRYDWQRSADALLAGYARLLAEDGSTTDADA